MSLKIKLAKFLTFILAVVGLQFMPIQLAIAVPISLGTLSNDATLNTDTSVIIGFTPTDTGTVYFAVLASATTDTATVKSAAIDSETVTIANALNGVLVSPLTPGKTQTIYAFLESLSGDSSVQSITVTTTKSIAASMALTDGKSVITITSSGFKTGLTTSDFTWNTGTTLLDTTTAVITNSSTSAVISFLDSATAGVLTVQAKPTAFSAPTDVPSNVAYIGRSTSGASGSTTSFTFGLITVTLNLPANLKTDQNVALDITLSPSYTASKPIFSVIEASGITSFDKPIELTLPDLVSGSAGLGYFGVSGIWTAINPITLSEVTSLCSAATKDGYIDNGATITIYSCHLTSFGYGTPQATLNVISTPTSVTAGSTSALSTTGGSGDGSVTYSTSSNASICTIAGSTLTAVGAGTCAVTATKAGDATYLSKTASLNVTINAAAAGGGGAVTYYAQPTITISSVDSTIQLDKTTTLSSGGGGGTGAVTYSTSTPTICSVTTAGVVTGLVAGTCLVKATKAASGTYLEGSSANLSITVSDSDKKAAEAAAAAAKAAADKAAAEKAAAEAAALAAAKAKADAEAKAAAELAAKEEAARLAAIELAAAQAEAARLAILNKNEITWKKSGSIYAIKFNLSIKYADQLVKIQVGTKVKGKIVYNTSDYLALNVNGDGTIKQKSAPKKGNYLRVLSGSKVIYTQLVK